MSLVPGLHDATLEGIELDWRGGSVRIAFSLGVDGAVPVILRADGLTNFACPRQSPWGPSDSVNEVTAKIMDAGQQVLIEMQSGDQIEILCEKVAIVENQR